MNSGLDQALLELSQKRSLTPEEMTGAMEFVVSGQASDATIEKFLLLLREKKETVLEIVAAARVMRSHSMSLSKKYPDLLDTCGTGGDAQHTLNISTLSALVACAAGVKIAKHGNRSVSSVSGSADLLEALGMKIDLPLESIEACLEKTGFAFFFAPKFHPATRYAVSARKKIQGKTIFNILGPLCNPAGVSYQVIGVYEHRLVGITANALLELGIKKALVVHGADGVDEISASSQTFAIELNGGQTREYTITPEECGVARTPIDCVRCKSKEQAKDLALNVLKGKKGPASDVVCLNSAAALYIAGKAESLKKGVIFCRELLERGKVYQKLEEIIAFSRERAG